MKTELLSYKRAHEAATLKPQTRLAKCEALITTCERDLAALRARREFAARRECRALDLQISYALDELRQLYAQRESLLAEISGGEPRIPRALSSEALAVKREITAQYDCDDDLGRTGGETIRLRRALGVCVHCGGALAEGSRSRCENHLREQRNRHRQGNGYSKSEYDARKRRGKCRECREAICAESTVFCALHLEKQRERSRRNYARSKAALAASKQRSAEPLLLEA